MKNFAIKNKVPNFGVQTQTSQYPGPSSKDVFAEMSQIFEQSATRIDEVVTRTYTNKNGEKFEETTRRTFQNATNRVGENSNANVKEGSKNSSGYYSISPKILPNTYKNPWENFNY